MRISQRYLGRTSQTMFRVPVGGGVFWWYLGLDIAIVRSSGGNRRSNWVGLGGAQASNVLLPILIYCAVLHWSLGMLTQRETLRTKTQMWPMWVKMLDVSLPPFPPQSLADPVLFLHVVMTVLIETSHYFVGALHPRYPTPNPQKSSLGLPDMYLHSLNLWAVLFSNSAPWALGNSSGWFP